MGGVARDLQEQHDDVEATLQAITAWAIRAVPNAEECGISYLVGGATIEARAGTSDLPKSVDALQERCGQGPCLDAARGQQMVRVDDVGADDRWPKFAQEAPELGVGSMLSFQLFVTGIRLGALNLYSRTPGAFDDEGQQIGLVYAAHAAVALAGAKVEEHLRIAMISRDLIGQAKGILMERHKLTADEAFGVLARVSQERNRKLVTIAAELTETGAMPESVRRRG